MIESLLTLFVKQIEVGFRYAVVTVHMPLCLVPDILDPVDVVFLFGDNLAQLMELMDRGIAVDPNQFGNRSRRTNCHKVLQ